MRTRLLVFGLLLAAVDVAAQPSGTPTAIDPRPGLRVGVLAGDTLQEFHQVAPPFLMPDGRLVVPVRGASSIRVFGEDGRFLASYGRAGGGPGEFTDLMAAWPRGDTIEALDWRLRRIVRFLPDGSSEEIPVDTNLPDLSGAAGVLGEGWAVAGVALGAFGRRDSVVVRRIGRDGRDIGEVAHVYGFARFRAPGLGGGPEPLSPRAALAVHGNRVYIAETLTPAVRVFGAAAAAPRQIRWNARPSGDSRATLRRVIDAAVDQAEPDAAVTTRRRLEAAPMPRQLPVFWTFVVDDLGFLWVRPYDPMRHAFVPFASNAAGGRWTILSPDGEVVGEVDVPADFEPSHITRDAVVGIARDEDGVESVRVHALRRR